MRRMWRRLLSLAYPAVCGLSFVLCFAMTALWARSIDTLDRLRVGTATRCVTLHVKEGEAFLDFATASGPVWAPGYQRIHASPSQFRPPRAGWTFAGFEGGVEYVKLRAYEGNAHIVRRFVSIPLWLVVVMTLVLPVLWYDAHCRSRAATATAPAAQPAPTAAFRKIAT